jgi:sulfide:quinone oxidoreductase
MAEIVVLGGGFGGLEAVNRMRRSLGTEHKITLVDKKDKFYMGLTKLWIVVGERTEAQCYTDMKLITKKGISYLNDEVTRIDTKSKTVTTTTSKLPYDFLIIALGANPSPQLVKGFGNGFNLYDITQGQKTHKLLEKMERGVISVIVAKPPYKCPPAPYEAAFIIDAFLRKQGRRENFSIGIFTPEPQPLALLGKTVGNWIRHLLEEKGINYHPNTKLNEIEEKSAVFDVGEFPSDLTFVPPHVVSSVVKSSGLAEGDWIEVDRRNLKTKFDRVYAIGDCVGVKLTNEMLLPKAGVLAEAEAQVVASDISAELTGSAKQEFNGKGYCFIEVGDAKATTLEADFFAEPNPVATTPANPSEEFRKGKIEFERERIARWFY